MGERYEDDDSLPTSYDEKELEDYDTVAKTEDTIGNNADYNGVVINDDDGITITSVANVLKLNAEKGIEISKLIGGAVVFSVDSTTGDGIFSGTVKVNAVNRFGNNAAVQLQNSDITGVNGIFIKDVADNEGEGVLFLKTGKTAGDYSNSTVDYWTLRVTGDGDLLLDGKVIANYNQGTFLFDGAAYPADGSTVTPTRTLANCPNGWILVWSDWNAGTPGVAGNFNWTTSIIPKFVGDNGQNWSFAIPTGATTGTYTDVASKQVTIYNDRLVGEAGNDTGLAVDVVLRYVIAF